MWDDDYAGTKAECQRLKAAGVLTFFGGDLNTPAQHLPTFDPAQVTVYNSAGYDKLLYIPAGDYDVEVGEPLKIGLHSDHDLHVMPVTLLLGSTVVSRFRFGTANVQHSMTTTQKREDIATVRAHCDVVVWQEIDTPAANTLIDETFPPDEFYHLFADLETDMSISRALFGVTVRAALPKRIPARYGRERISTGKAHISPHRYDVWAVCTPILQTS